MADETLDLVQDAVLVPEVRDVLIAGELDISGSGDVLGDVAMCLGLVLAAVKDQGW